MGKKIEYAGEGDWKIMVRLPEQLAVEVHSVLMRRGSTCAEFIRAAVADSVQRAKAVPQ